MIAGCVADADVTLPSPAARSICSAEVRRAEIGGGGWRRARTSSRDEVVGEDGAALDRRADRRRNARRRAAGREAMTIPRRRRSATLAVNGVWPSVLPRRR